jgi:choline kinase
VDAVILVAGRATRLRPLTDATPKALLPVGGVPILERSVAALAAAGVRRFVLVTGYRAEQIRAATSARFPDLEVRFVHNDRWDSAQNCVSLLVGVQGLESFVALDGDLVFEPAVAGALLTSPHANVCAVRHAPDLGAEEMKVELDDAGRVRAVSKELPLARAAAEAVGMWRFESGAAAVTRALEHRIVGLELADEYYEASFQEAIDGGVAVHAVDVTGSFVAEIDTAEDLAAVDQGVRAAVGA